MLHLEEIRKTYHAGGFDQAALDGVTLTFRDSEFVAVLGPSGSGKTTLLNIVGGLDHYDSGDLVIDSISTKEYSDRDWDAYRNNRVGFVFQSYNLIPHQTVLANVELALTLSGVSRAERTSRAQEALDKVGLSEHVRKLPSQLSGGQMQRVAIARALINDPEILLADEPTGALDSKTSTAVMNLLQEIARDRLVVMVTHNPDLATEYATRTVSLKDGRVTDDTDPFVMSEESRGAKPARRTSMSFLTAIALSFRNLMTKKGRTFMTSFAGSIGIVGIATILALSNGVNAYIRGVEEDTLSMYPLSITSQGVDLTAFLAGNTGSSDSDSDEDAQVHETKMISNMFNRVGNNDLAALKTYLDSQDSMVSSYSNAIQYGYSVVPQIYSSDTSTIRQVNPNHAFSSLGFSSDSSSSALISTGMSMDVFSSLPDDVDMVKGQYIVVDGRWPQSYNECVLVLTESGGVSDFLLYAMGLRDPSELDQMVQSLAQNKAMSPFTDTDTKTFTYDQMMAVSFKLVEATDYYQWDPSYSLWTDMRTDPAYMKSLVGNGETMKIVGVVKPDPTASATMLNQGLYYPSSLVHHLMDDAANSQIVQQQMASPNDDVLTGKTFAEEAQRPGLTDFDFSSLISVDQSQLSDLFTMDMSGFSPTLNLNMNSLANSIPQVQPPDLAQLLSGMDVQVDPDALTSVMEETLASYLSDVYGVDTSGGVSGLPTSLPTSLPTALPTNLPTSLPTDLPTALPTSLPTALPTNLPTSLPTDLPTALPTNLPTSLPTSLPTALPTSLPTSTQSSSSDPPSPSASSTTPTSISTPTPTSTSQQPTQSPSATPSLPEIPDPSQIVDSFSTWLQQPQVQAQVAASLGSAFNATQIQDQLQNALASYMQRTMTTVLTSMMSSMQSQIQLALRATMSQFTTYMTQAMDIDPEKFRDLFKFNMDEDQLTTLLTSLLSTTTRSQDSNLQQLGYAKASSPSRIDIYPKDFAAKQSILDILDAYNADMKASGQDEKVITYTDIVGTLMSSVTDIINKISAVLVAFVSISLVVSSIMIGVITYISVLERKKEIGILRALGASKRDIGNVFNAETLIVGLIAGVMGVLITLVLIMIANPIIEANFDVARIARLPVSAALALIGISMVLTFIAGLIPSSAASRRDPVEALRSE